VREARTPPVIWQTVDSDWTRMPASPSAVYTLNILLLMKKFWKIKFLFNKILYL
jgi:hypothetical protein